MTALSEGVTTVKFTATIPTQDYGNLGYELSWEGPPQSPANAEEIMGELRRSVAHAILPIVEAQIDRAEAMGKFKLVSNPEVWLLANARIFFWLRTNAPEIEIPALNRVMQKYAKPLVFDPADEQADPPAVPTHAAPGKQTPEEIKAQFASMGIQVNTPPAPPDKPAQPKGTSRLNQPKKNRIGKDASA